MGRRIPADCQTRGTLLGYPLPRGIWNPLDSREAKGAAMEGRRKEIWEGSVLGRNRQSEKYFSLMLFLSVPYFIVLYNENPL
jgi:hypothetical protein